MLWQGASLVSLDGWLDATKDKRGLISNRHHTFQLLVLNCCKVFCFYGFKRMFLQAVGTSHKILVMVVLPITWK